MGDEERFDEERFYVGNDEYLRSKMLRFSIEIACARAMVAPSAKAITEDAQILYNFVKKGEKTAEN